MLSLSALLSLIAGRIWCLKPAKYELFPLMLHPILPLNGLFCSGHILVKATKIVIFKLGLRIVDCFLRARVVKQVAIVSLFVECAPNNSHFQFLLLWNFLIDSDFDLLFFVLLGSRCRGSGRDSDDRGDLFSIKRLSVSSRFFIFLFFWFILHFDVTLALFLQSEWLKFFCLSNFSILIFLDLACLKLIHSLDLFFVFLVFDIFVAVQIIVKVDYLPEGDTVQNLHSLERGVVQSKSV